MVIFLMRDREGLAATLWTCALGLLLGAVIAVGPASLVTKTLSIDLWGLATTVVAIAITAIWVNKSLIKRKPPNDLRNQ